MRNGLHENFDTTRNLLISTQNDALFAKVMDLTDDMSSNIAKSDLYLFY